MEEVGGVKKKSKRKESRYAYLIGFIDDYSRYVVGLELYRSQTADQVLEVYCRPVVNAYCFNPDVTHSSLSLFMVPRFLPLSSSEASFFRGLFYQ